MPGKLLASLRYSWPLLAFEARWKRWRRHRRLAPDRSGYCPICTEPTEFGVQDYNPREGLVCLGCGSVPRQRALVHTVCELGLAGGKVHESSPSLCTFWFFQRHCRDFAASYYWPDRATDARVGAFRNVDLGAQPFADASFDLVVTQDVLEHLPDPLAAVREIHRTLGPESVHAFTVPRLDGQTTETRAVLRGGKLHHEKPEVYHRDPIDRRGSLVITDWGTDLERWMTEAAPMTCEVRRVHDEGIGIPAPIEVFVARNAPGPAQGGRRPE